jgi:hypothetical protein
MTAKDNSLMRSDLLAYDQTVRRPARRRKIKACTITLTSFAPDQASGAFKINIDPMQMADGIAPTDDRAHVKTKQHNLPSGTA